MTDRTEEIINLLNKNNYLTNLESEFLKRNMDKIQIKIIPKDVIEENLNISLTAGKLTPGNIRDFKALLNKLKEEKEKNVLSVTINISGNNRKIYVNSELKYVIEEI